MEPTHLNEAMRRLRAPRQLLGDELAEFHRAATGALLPTSQQPDGRFLDPATHRATGIWTAAVEWTCRQLDPLAVHLASQSQATQTATALRNSLFPGPSIAEVLEAKDREIAALRAHLAGQSQATRAVPDLHNAIMNLPALHAQDVYSTTALAYKCGHRDARHAAAELVNEAEAAQEVTQQAAPAGHVVDIDRNCNESIINVALEPGTEIYLAPVTQQAAKAETAEQAWISVDDDSRKPEVGRPILMFVRTEMHGEDDEGHSFTTEGEEVAMGEYRKSPSYDVHYFDCYTSPMSDNDWITHWMPLPPAPDQTQPAGAARQGGNTSKENGSDLVPTTSTVSAPEEVRNAILEEAATACFCAVANRRPVYAKDCVELIRALKRTTSGKGETA